MSIRYWATLKNVSCRKEIASAINTWYHQEASPTDPTCCASPFCFEMSVDELKVKLDVSTLMPSKCAYMICFRYHEHSKTVGIVGACTYKQVTQEWDGLILHYKLSKSRNCGLVKEEDNEETSDVTPPLFEFPTLMLDTLDESFMDTIRRNPPTLQACKDRLDWMFKFEQTKELEGRGLESARLSFYMALLGHYMSQHSTYPLSLIERYNQIRVDSERAMLDKNFEPFMDSQDAVSLLLSHNGMNGWVMQTRLDDPNELVNAVWPNLRDEQDFFKRFPITSDPPKYYISIPAENLPITLPLYPPNGHVHVSYKHVKEWVWQTYLVKSHLVYLIDEIPSRVFIMMNELGKYVNAYLSSHEPPKRISVVKQEKKHEYVFNRKHNTGPPVVVDIEMLWQISPPCLSCVRNERRMFVNKERVGAVKIWREANIDKSSVKNLMEDLCGTYSKKGEETLAKRFASFDQAWDGNDKRYWCSYAIDNALKGVTDDLTCKFVDKTKSAEENLPLCAEKCSGRSTMIGPHQYVRNMLKALLF